MAKGGKILVDLPSGDGRALGLCACGSAKKLTGGVCTAAMLG
jgi:hypothetical protein